MPVAVCGEGVVGGEEQLTANPNTQTEEDLAKGYSVNERHRGKRPHSNGQAEQDAKLDTWRKDVEEQSGNLGAGSDPDLVVSDKSVPVRLKVLSSAVR